MTYLRTSRRRRKTLNDTNGEGLVIHEIKFPQTHRFPEIKSPQTHRFHEIKSPRTHRFHNFFFFTRISLIIRPEYNICWSGKKKMNSYFSQEFLKNIYTELIFAEAIWQLFKKFAKNVFYLKKKIPYSFHFFQNICFLFLPFIGQNGAL